MTEARHILDVPSMVRQVKDRAEGDEELTQRDKEGVVQDTIYTLLLAATIGPSIMLRAVHIVRSPN